MVIKNRKGKSRLILHMKLWNQTGNVLTVTHFVYHQILVFIGNTGDEAGKV